MQMTQKEIKYEFYKISKYKMNTNYLLMFHILKTKNKQNQ